MAEKKETKKVAKKDVVIKKVKNVEREDHVTGCCGGTCNIHTPKRVIAYRDERFMFGFVAGLAIAALAGFILLLNAGTIGNKSPKKLTAPAPSAPTAAVEEEQQIVLEAVTKNDWMRGDKDAPITIVEFSDIDCPFCKSFHVTMKRIMKEYDGKVNWVYRHAPRAQRHPDARAKAVATECIGAEAGQDAFWKSVDRLSSQKLGTLSAQEVRTFAVTLGVDGKEFDACMEAGTYAQKVQDHLVQSSRAGMRGTPYSVIIAGEQLIPISGALPYNRVKALIDPLLAQ